MSSIFNILQELDNEISEYNKALVALEEKYNIKNGEIEEKLLEDFTQQQQEEKEKFEVQALATENKLDEACRQIRKRQPLLTSLMVDDANLENVLPDEIVLGKYNVSFGNFNNKVPKTIPFPVEKPLYIDNTEDEVLTHKLLLRLLFALPLGKCQFTVYDPKSFGFSAQDFVSLASVEKVVPCQKFITDEKAFKEQLEQLLNSATQMIQTQFPNCSRNCRTWLDYNREMLQRHEYQKLLPYRILLVYNLNPSTNQEIMRYLEILASLGTKCGLLVVFSYDKQSFDVLKENHNDRSLERMEKFLAMAQPLRSFYGSLLPKMNLQNLQIAEEGEPYPDEEKINNLIYDFKELILNSDDTAITFTDLINLDDMDKMYDGSSVETVAIPLGSDSHTGNIAKLDVGDLHVHTLIGGQTGSGKSNLLHNIILNACWHYSPDELNLYLLDLKDGVEFNVYAAPALPHAKLVATAADTEYGASVIEYLVQEKERRNDLFKEKSVGNTKITNYIDYRKRFKKQILPRIILIVDEFQVLFEGKNAERNKDAIQNLAKLGRSCGIHMIFATQTIKGITSFRDILTQFNTRIALKCGADDSKRLLGDTFDNDAAAKVKKHHGIYNDSSGLKEANVDFAIPYADPALMQEVIRFMHDDWKDQDGKIDTRVFEGQKLPSFPIPEFFDSRDNSGAVLHFGEEFNFESAPLTVKFGKSEEDNLFVIGSDANFKQGMLHSVLLSANGNEAIKEIIYVGDGEGIGLQAYQEKTGLKPVTVYANASEFINSIKDKFDSCGRIVIFDKCMLKKELKGYPSLGTNLKDEALLMETYFEEKEDTQNYVVAFYDRYNSLQNSGLDFKNLFAHRICFGMSVDEINKNFSEIRIKSKTVTANRALYFTMNSDAYTWFRPYVFPKEE
jgi:hypothetical protein